MCFGRFVAASNIVHAENDRCHVYTASTTRIYHSNVYDTSIFSSFERGVRTYKCCYETSEYLMGIPHGLYGSSIDRVRLVDNDFGNIWNTYSGDCRIKKMIKFENVNVTMQGKRILSDINLEIQDGEFVLICGESGCGKTTMTKLINGLIPHFVRDVSVDGTITVCGKNVAEMPMYEIAELVGSVFQNPKTQFFYTNSNAEMAFGLENRGVEPEYIRKRIKNTINELDIEKLEDRDVFSMSGGEKQLLAFASVYAMNPQIYVLDEPSANLDIAAMEKLSERMKVIKEKGHTVVVAEHRLAWIQKFADRIIYMKEGRIEQEFTSDEFKALSDLKRKQMGLRSIVPEQIQIPEITGNSEDAVLQICNLSCKRKKQMIFQNISLSARAGDIIGITGKNGAGKSTFCNCLCGLLKPKGGEILYQGKKLTWKSMQNIIR